MKLILKVILLSRPKEKGFVLPVIIALGLIMTLLGTISIFQSSDEQLTASSQRATAKALAAAEIGVNHYRELIDSNKIIALYPSCVNWNDQGDTDPSNDACDDGTSVLSWFNAANTPSVIPNVNDSCFPNLTQIATESTRSWQNITTGNPAAGQYRLINYTYNPGANDGTTYTTQPFGTLTVEGRVNQKNTLATEQQAAVARVEVELPIQPGIPAPTGTPVLLEGDFNHFHPALWISGDAEGVTDSRKLKVTGNILITDTDDCNQANTTDQTKINTDNLQDSDKQSIVLTPIDPKVSPYGYRTAPGSNVNSLSAADINNGITLPRPGDVFEHIDSNTNSAVDPGEEVYYHYDVDSLSGEINIQNEDIKIIAGRKVILYVDVNMTFQANNAVDNVDINQDSSNSSYFLEIYGASGAQEINFKGNSTPADNGEINIKAFVHAPNATVKVTEDPNITITGAMWVKDWDGDNNLTNNVVIQPDSSNATRVSEQYYNYTYIRDTLVGSQARVADPVISIPSRWETLEAE